MTKRHKIDILRSEFRRKGGGSRQTILRLLGGKLDREGAVFHKERLQFEDEKEGPRIVDIVQTNTCAFGHTIDDKARVAGVCQIGNEILCSTEGCMLRCVHCGATVCCLHGSTYGDKTYCRRHRWIHYWRLFWRID